MPHCTRCDKYMDLNYDFSLHTCQPSKKYISGVIEGLNLALSTFKDMTPTQLAYVNSFELQERIFQNIRKLITQYQEKK